MSWRKILDSIIRWATGSLFIFSGMIKLNDPIGTEIKLEEYFEVFANDFAEFFHVFVPAALEIGMILIILEVLLGVAVLLNYRMIITTKILLGMIIFFTFLTFYSAYFNKVTDCGCFGDAIPLTPWQSFYKDVILVLFILHLFWYRTTWRPKISEKAGNMVVGGLAIICLVVGIYAIEHLPFIDFRAYKVGDSIPANMVPEEQPIFEYTFTRDGEEVKSQRYLLEKDGYELKAYEVINEDKTTPKITDYNVWNPDVGDYTQQSFEGNKLFVIILNSVSANTENLTTVVKLIAELGNSVEAIVLTSSDPVLFEFFRHEHQLAIPYFFSDATVLKAMIRSNPGVMVVNNGEVRGKWHYNDIPEAARVTQLLR